MSKKMILSVVVVLIAVSAVRAQFPPPIAGLNFQAQSLDVALANLVGLDGGLNASIVSNQRLTWNSAHSLEQMGHNAIGHQGSIGFISEDANADGNSATLLIGQGVLTGGAQAQHMGNGVDPVMHGQGLGLIATSGIQKAGGMGIGNAAHVIVLDNSQTAGNLVGVAVESSSVLGTQTQSYSGQADSIGLIESSLAVSTNQQQIIGDHQPPEEGPPIGGETVMALPSLETIIST